MTEATEWLDAAKLDPQVRAKIEHNNAQALLKLT
jgi:predicted TIM-barrel fold metal-dependent hydrolase